MGVQHACMRMMAAACMYVMYKLYGNLHVGMLTDDVGCITRQPNQIPNCRTSVSFDLCGSKAWTPRLSHELRKASFKVAILPIRVGFSEEFVDLLLLLDQFRP